MKEQTRDSLPVIMLIDDTIEDLYINHRIIQKHGNFNQIIQFSMGTDALNYLKSNIQNKCRIPEIILVDIHMPQMNGFEFLEEFAKFPEEIKAISKVYILSSSFDRNDINKADANPYVNRYFEKPLTKEIVQELLG